MIFIVVNTGHPDPLPPISEIVVLRRKSLGVSQRQLADLLHIAVHTLSNIESGKGNPSLKVIGRLLDCLGLQLKIEPRSPLAAPEPEPVKTT